MKVSKQALWQRKRVALGLCPICAEPKSATSVRCEKHRQEANRRNHERLKKPGVREYHRQQSKRWREENPERYAKLQADWRAAHPDYHKTKGQARHQATYQRKKG